MAHLLAHGAPVPRVFADASGETAIEIGEWTYEVHEAPEGVDLYEDALSWTPFRSRPTHTPRARRWRGCILPRRDFGAAAQAAAAGGQLHHLCRAESARGDGALSGCAAQLWPTMQPMRAGCDEALELLAPFHAELLPLLPALDAAVDTQRSARVQSFLERCERRRAGHGDHRLRPRRPHQRGARSGPRHRAQHRGVACAASKIRRIRTMCPCTSIICARCWTAMSRCARFQREEAAALAPMTALCHAEFALSEADYFLRRAALRREGAHGLRRLAGGPCALVPRCGRREAAGCSAQWAAARKRRSRRELADR